MKRLSFLIPLVASISLAVAQPNAIVDDPQTEAHISKSVARVLENYHYSRTKLDDDISAKFLARYFEVFDPQRLHFLQSDIEEFSTYRHQLDDFILKTGDTSPAHKIFARLTQRVDERIAFVNELLRNEKFEFKNNDRYTLNRKDSPRPKNLQEAKDLWRQHLRFEYLQEKLSLLEKEKKDKEKEKAARKKDDKAKKEKKSTEAAAKKLTPQEEIMDKLTKRYTRLQKNIKDLGPDEVLEIYLTSLSRVYDPHSDYMGRAQMENFAISMKLSLFGIGAVLTTDDQGYCKIQELKDGPAKASKQIKVGDRIVAVAQAEKEAVDCIGMKLNKVVEMIRGEKGTRVRLTVFPVDSADPSDTKVVTLVRDQIKLDDQESKAKLFEIPSESGKPLRIGLLDLPSFYEDMEDRGANHKSMTADISRLLKKLKEENVNGLIIDLRRNGGGALSEAIRLTGLFIKKGPVVQTKDFGGRIDVKSDSDPGLLYDGPVIVLTSRFSASASEILAGALQDYGRAVIVGDSSTHGKGTVQQLLGLENIMRDAKLDYAYNPGALKFTIQKFYRAGGASTQVKGVVPDIILPSVNNHAEIGEGSLDDPLPWDSVGSAKFEKLNRVEPYLADLKKNSDQRLKGNKDFGYIQEDIERYKKTVADKTVSLNEKERLKEKDELDATIESRKKDWQSRKKSDEKIYEVTLKNVDKPGLEIAQDKKDKEETIASEDEDPEDETPSVDATLEETKRIMADYISLSAKDRGSVTLVK